MTFTWDEMIAVECLVSTLQNTAGAVFTSGTLVSALTDHRLSVDAEGRSELDAALVKLGQEPAALLSAWLSGRADWTSLAYRDRFALVLLPPGKRSRPWLADILDDLAGRRPKHGRR
jgi:hypothetical protein